MNRITTALLAALEALIVVAIGVGIALVPLTILWGTHYGLGIDWFVFWRAAVDVWLLGNGVDLAVQLPIETISALNLPGAESPFSLTFALLGFALLAILLGVRTGRRAAGTGYSFTAAGAAILSYGLLAALLTFSAGTAVVTPAAVQGVLLPTLIFAGGVLIGLAGAPRAAPSLPGWASRPLGAQLRRIPAEVQSQLAAALRGGTAAVAGIMIVSGLAVFVSVLANFATVIGLYETLQADVMGGIALTIAQLAFIPNVVIWAASWFVGPGIALGAGSSVSPLGTTLDAVPGLPLFGALPHGTLEFGFLGLLVPVLVGFVSAVLVRQSLDKRANAPHGSARMLITGALMGVVAGILLGLLSWWSAGAMGPGRLTEVGPNPLLVGALTTVEVGVAAALGMLVGGRRARSTDSRTEEVSTKR
ncbi:cell division protein PerM [Cryobacterium sp. W22_MBD10_FK3]|uniref:cell division protein PerM n=1 Tax=Cryobacterium sp. W22_MBD10_FK3 TaxID=3240273 RepID=UPI003F93365B